MPKRTWDAPLKLLERGQLLALLDAATLLTSSLESRRVLRCLMELTNSLLRTEASSLILVDEKGKRLVFKSTAGAKAEEAMGLTLDLGDTIAKGRATCDLHFKKQ